MLGKFARACALNPISNGRRWARRWRGLGAALAVGAIAAGCGAKIDGPLPSLESVLNAEGTNVICTCDALGGCVKQANDVLTLSGAGFAPLPVSLLDQPRLELPDVLLISGGGQEFTIRGDDPTQNAEGVGLVYKDDKTLELTLTPAYVKDLPPDKYTVSVVNPNGNRVDLSDGLEVVLGPQVEKVEPPIICPSIDQKLTISGKNFREGSSVALVDPSGPTSFPIPADAVTIKDGDTIEITVASGSVPVGTYDVLVRLAEGCEHTLADAVQMVPPPTLESVAPEQLCDDLDTKITLKGKDFRDGATVAVDGKPLPAADVTVVDASTIEATVRKGAADGTFDVTVTNPEGCASTLSGGLTINPPPTLASVLPTTQCTGGSITLTGTGFLAGASVSVAGTPLAAADVTVDSSSQISAALTAVTPGGPFDLSVQNADGCASAVLAAALTITQGPTVLTVDPSTVYNKVNFPIAIFGSGFDASSKVTISTSPPTELTVTQQTAERIDAVVPSGVAPGTYDVTITDAQGCGFTAVGLLIVTDQLSVRVCGIDPPFGWNGETTPVTITSGSGAGCSAGTDTFVSTPRAWLAIGGNLTALRSVGFVTDTSLTGRVPSGLAVGGPYDLLVQNPDGSIGVLAAAFEVVSLPVPRVDAINPGAVDTQYNANLVLSGANFRDPVTVELIAADGTSTPLANPVVNGTNDQITVGLDVGTLGLATGAYVLRVTNTDQGTYSDFSALPITNPAGNLDAWTTAGTMVTARRRHALVSGRISAAARFLYAIGGDGGTAAPAALDTIDIVPLDKFGNTGTWLVQRYKLNTPRTALSAVAQGRYLYAIGGDSGSGPLATVERAVILDPADAPELSSFSYTLGGTLAKGAWYYRVSATLPSSDVDNPGGETLPSDPVVIQAIDNVKVSLSWDVPASLQGVTGVTYNVYRTPTPDGAIGGEQLLADGLTATSYEDSGGAIKDATHTPLPQGSTGVFVETGVPTLTTARSGAAAGVAHDANGDAFLYVVGGRSDATTVLDTVELAAISADGGTLGAFAPAANKLRGPRERLLLGVGEHETSPKIPAGTTYLYAAGGFDGTAGDSSGSAASIALGGAPGSFAQVNQFKSAPIAAAGHMVVDTFYYFGGSNDGSNASATAFSCRLSNSPPGFVNCNSLGPAALPAPRMNAALTLESAFFYLTGGGATDGVASTTVIKTVY